MTRIESIKRRLAAATPGPWTPCTWDPMDAPHVHVNVDEQGQRCTRRNSFTVLSKADAEAIAHAPQDLRDLLELYEVVSKGHIPFGDDTDCAICLVLSKLDSPVGDEGAE